MDRAQLLEEKWQAIADRVGGERGEKLVRAFKDYYRRIYTPELPEWFARLYDKNIGGFYFSNSARDNDTLIYKEEEFGLLPDADSTWQTMCTIVSMGLTNGKPYREFIPSEIQAKIIAFLKGLQDRDGFFYHPQFPRERNEKKVERRSRDTSRAVAVITAFGALPTYDTPNGVIGDGILADGRRVEKPKKSARSEEVVEKVTENTASVAPFLQSKEAFLEHLASKELKNHSYVVGSHFITQSSEMTYRDKVLRESGADYTIYGLLTDWLSENQLENGIWDEKIGYSGVSGIMKICRLYSSARVMLPRAELTARAAISVVTSPDMATSVTDIFNPWVAAGVILSDLRKIGGEEGKKIAEKISNELIDNAEVLLDATAEKLERFIRADGAFSYPVKSSGGYNMGMPLGIAWIDEGDVNATHLAVSAVSNIFTAMNLGDLYVAPYGEDDGRRFIEIITSP
jgi:hypothetical protein